MSGFLRRKEGLVVFNIDTIKDIHRFFITVKPRPEATGYSGKPAGVY
jgi:hypothetical protein